MLTTGVVCFALAAAPSVGATPGVVYRFETEKESGAVWAAGGNARLEFDEKEGRPRSPVIWRDGGRQILLVNDVNRTYYNQVAYLRKFGEGLRSVEAMSVSAPFEIADVRNIQIDVRPHLAPANGCRLVKEEFSYVLRLAVKAAPGTFPGRVDGVDELCLAEGFPVAVLPFGHGPAPRSGIEAVDKAFAERFAPLRGLPVSRKLSVIRRIEGGTNVTSRLELKDLRSAKIPAERFEVPAGYRYQEPIIVKPKRQD